MSEPRPSVPLRSYLSRLILVCVLPLLALSVWLSWRTLAWEEADRRQEAHNLSANFANAMDQRLGLLIRAMGTLADSPLLDHAARWPEFLAEAEGFQRQFGSRVILAEGQEPFRMFLRTGDPFGSPLPSLPCSKGTSAAPLAMRTGKPAVGDVVIGTVSGTPLVAVAVPITRLSGRPLVLLTTLETRLFDERLKQLALPPGWTLRLEDGAGQIIAVRQDPDRYLSGSPVGFRVVQTFNLSSWKVVLEIPEEVMSAGRNETLLILLLGLLGASVVALVGGSFAVRRLTLAVGSLAKPGSETEGAASIREIDETRQKLLDAGRELEENATRFRQVFEDAPLPMCHVSAAGVMLAMNRRFREGYGYDLQSVPDLDSWWVQAYPDPAYRAWVQERWREVVDQAIRENRDIESDSYRITCGDGREKIVKVGGISMQDGFLATFTDVTEQHRTEESLRLWGEAFEHSRLGLAITNARNNTFTAVNPAFARERGYSPLELIGQSVATLFPPELMDELRQQIQLASERNHVVFETEHLTRDGHRFPVLLDMTVLKDASGQPVQRITYALNISARKQAEAELRALQDADLERQRAARQQAQEQKEIAEEARRRAETALAALRESEERLQLFIEHSPAALAMFDRQMRYLAVSRRWLEDYGLKDQTIIGRCHYEFFPEIGEAWKSVHRRGLAGEVIREEADRFERLDGQVQWIRWEVRPWDRADGQVGGIVIFAEEMTAQKQAEEEIRSLNANLERRVQERTAELSAANLELDSFAYAVSHDLRAPLRAMNGFSHAMLEDYGPGLDAGAQVFLDQIILASQKMADLIDGLLSLSRSTRGEVRREQLDISAMAREQFRNLAAQNPDRAVDWSVEEGLTARGDGRMLEVVLANLLGNAWKYTEKAESPAIRVGFGQCGELQGICISDNGAGFDMAHSARLFKPFQRLHRQDEFPGIGIGLATVQRIIQRHGGQISACGAPGQGATFCFRLPEGDAAPGGDIMETES